MSLSVFETCPLHHRALPTSRSIASASVHTNTGHVIRAKNHRYGEDPIMQLVEAVGGSHNEKLVKL